MRMSDEVSQSQFLRSGSCFIIQRKAGSILQHFVGCREGDKSGNAFKYWVSIAFFLPWADIRACGMI